MRATTTRIWTDEVRTWETTVAVVSTDHILTAVDELAVDDLDGEPILLPLDVVVA